MTARGRIRGTAAMQYTWGARVVGPIVVPRRFGVGVTKGARLSSPGTTGKPRSEAAEPDAALRPPAEAELHRAVSLLQGTLDSTADGLLVIDAQGRIVSYNQRFIQMWG